MRPRDWRVAELATRQHGVVAARQLGALGLSRQDVARRVGAGRLHRIHQGVFAVGHRALTRDGRFMAAVLAGGEGAVLSHRSAAIAWSLSDVRTPRVDLTAAVRGRRCIAGVVVHTTRHFRADDHTRHRQVPTTTPSRTLFDLADVVGFSELRRCFAAAARARLIELDALHELRQISRGRRGRWNFARALDEHEPAAERMRSELEAGFRRLCVDHRLPKPHVNAQLHGYEVDALWPDARLVVELDGHEFHADRTAFERDRIRDAALQAAGYRVVRLTHRRLRDSSATVADQIRAILTKAA